MSPGALAARMRTGIVNDYVITGELRGQGSNYENGRDRSLENKVEPTAFATLETMVRSKDMHGTTESRVTRLHAGRQTAVYGHDGVWPHETRH